jgi:hypothetical protein
MAFEVGGEFVEPSIGAEQGAWNEAGRQHPLNHQHAFGDHQGFSGRQIRPSVDAVEITEVVDSGIAGIVDVD